MRDAYIVTSIRTPGCKRTKGAFKDTRPEDLLSFILDKAVEKTPGLSKDKVDDIMIGCAFPEAEQGLNIGRVASQMAGFPETVSRGHGQPVLRIWAGGHRPGLFAGHGGLVRHHHRRGHRVHDFCSHGRQHPKAPPRVFKHQSRKLHIHGNHRRKRGQTL